MRATRVMSSGGLPWKLLSHSLSYAIQSRLRRSTAAGPGHKCSMTRRHSSLSIRLRAARQGLRCFESARSGARSLDLAHRAIKGSKTAMPTNRDAARAFMPYPDAAVPHAEAGPLAGLTFAVKDLFDVAGYPTSGGQP